MWWCREDPASGTPRCWGGETAGGKKYPPGGGLKFPGPLPIGMVEGKRNPGGLTEAPGPRGEGGGAEEVEMERKCWTRGEVRRMLREGWSFALPGERGKYYPRVPFGHLEARRLSRGVLTYILRPVANERVLELAREARERAERATWK